MKKHTDYFPTTQRCLLILMVMSCSIYTSAQWIRQYPVPKMEWLLDIDVSTDGYGYAVGGDDMVVKLDPSTMTWSTLTTPDYEWTLNAVDCPLKDGRHAKGRQASRFPSLKIKKPGAFDPGPFHT